MPKVSSTATLKQLLKDVTNVQELLDGSSVLIKALKKDCLEKDKLDEIIEKARVLIVKLKTEVDTINDYFKVAHGGDAAEGDSLKAKDGASVSINGDVEGHKVNEASHLNGEVGAEEENSSEGTAREENALGGNKGEDAEMTMSASETAKSNINSTNSGNLEEISLGDSEKPSSDDLKEAPGDSDDLKEALGASDNLKEAPGDSDDLKEAPGDSDDLKEDPGDSDNLKEALGASDDLKEAPGDSDDLKEAPRDSDDLKEVPGDSVDNPGEELIAEEVAGPTEEGEIAGVFEVAPEEQSDSDDDVKQEQSNWTIKCVDISKLINPDLLSGKSAAVAAAADKDEAVVVLSDSDGDGNAGGKKDSSKLIYLQGTNDLVVQRIKKNINLTLTRQSKGVIVLDDSDSSDDQALSKIRSTINQQPPENNRALKTNGGKVPDKKRKSVRFNVSDENDKADTGNRRITRTPTRFKKAKKKCEYSSSDSEGNGGDTKVKKKQRKKEARDLASVSSLSDTNTDSDSDGDKRQKSKKKSFRAKEDSAALERRLIASQTDEKLSWKTQVHLIKAEAHQLKENYDKRLLKDEIDRLTNLDSLKRTRRATKGSQSSDSADSMSVKKQRVRRSSDPEKQHGGPNCSSSDKSECEIEQPAEDPLALSEDPLALPEEIEQVNASADKEDDIVSAVLGAINPDSESSAHDNSGADSKESDAEQNESGGKKADDKEEKKKDELQQKEGDPTGPEKDKSWRKDNLLTEKLSESDSDEQFSKYLDKKKKLGESQSDTEDLTAKRIVKRTGKRKVRIVNSDSDSSSKPVSSNENSDKESRSSDSSIQTEKARNTKRRRIRTIQDSSDENDKEDKSTRKNIRKVWANDSLAETTKQAEKEEQERKTRIAERQKKYNQLFNVNELLNAKVDKVVLDFNEETKEELLQVDAEIVKHMKPHQAKGVQFMWTACFESLERAKSTKGSGCILAHCMGLGKTLQVIALTHALLSKAEETGVSKLLVVTPLNTVLNWVAEFRKWLPNEDDVEVYELVSFKQNYERQYEVQQWTKNGGVLIVGYDMFRNLTNPTNKRLSKKMRNVFQSALVDPGPDMVVCDEGHLLKNEKTSLSIAMNRLRTLRRVVLTGTPLQNNLKEYFCMVQFVKPNLLGTYKEYLNRFVNPITNGQYTDSTQHDIQIMRKRSHVLHKLLDGIVQRRDYAVLAPFLPPKHEYILFINLTEVQIKLYEHYLREKAQIRTSSKGKSYLFIDFQEFLRICTHPRVLNAREKKDFVDDEDSEGSLKEFIDDREASTTSASSSDSNSGSASEHESAPKPTKPKRVTRSTADQIVLSDNEEEALPTDPSEWWRQYCQNDVFECLNYSGKLFVLFEILHECEQIGDKILVFSQSLYSLDVIEYFLGKVDEATQSEKSDTSAVGGHPGSWSLGLDYFRLDGSSSCDNRASWCKTFNDPENTRARLFLISTRAGGLGINLVAANRVIIFDVSWNPSHDVQSIYRVYRFGQLKPCYVYRFVTLGTMEMKIYERQVIKQAISKRVIDEQQIDRHYNQNDLAELYRFEPKPDEERPIPLVPKDVLLGELLQKFGDRIHKYHEHQSLLENKEEECLNEDERKAAWEEFENEKKARQFPNVLNNIPIQTVVLALTSIIQKDNPTWDTLAVQSIVPQLVKELEQQLQFGNMSMYNRIINEVRLMQNAKQQQRLQEYYYRQQQQALLMRQYQMMKQNSSQYPTGMPPRSFNPGPSATIPTEVIDLND